MTPSNIEQILADTFAPAIDRNAPYAKVMFQKAALEIAIAHAAEIDPLRAALRPFAGSRETSPAETDVPNESPVTIRCQLGDVRRALKALNR